MINMNGFQRVLQKKWNRFCRQFWKSEVEPNPFAILYGDGRVYRGVPGNARAADVQVIVQYDDDRGWILTQMFDFYIWRFDFNRWVGVDWPGVVLYVLSAPVGKSDTGWKKILVGQTTKHANYDRLYTRGKWARNYAREHGQLPGRI